MRTQFTCVALSALALKASAAPSQQSNPATIPQNDRQPKKRADGVAVLQDGFIYGPSLIGEAAPFPNGTLGNAMSARDMDIWRVDREAIDAAIQKDVEAVTQAIGANGGLNTLEDYAEVLYTNQWTNSNPRGTAPGIMTNATKSDLLFSMERLSQNAYPLRIIEVDEELPFQFDDDLTWTLTGSSLEDLRASGSLFYVDHGYQTHYVKSTLEPKRYDAACSAYFFIHPESKDFLPLAIKTQPGKGKGLIYTPLDTENDWLLAKMMFNVNDMFHAQMLHLVITHDVSEAAHQAALHTMSEDHPIMVILDRLMLQGYSSRIVGEELCFNPGGHWSQLMAIDELGARQFVNSYWPTAGRYQAGYLKTDLKARGLINDKDEFPFKNFPFFEDANVIHAGYKQFFQSFVDSYYKTDADVAADFEVQNWFTEATEHAGVHDFPQGKADKEILVDVLTHFGFIVSVGHHALNGGDPVGSKATLPFHLPAIFAPAPKAKGVTDLMPFMPSVAQSIHYIGFIASFNRPFYETSERTLEYAFSNDKALSRLNKATHTAAATFMTSMQTLSDEIRGRTFDKDGLSMGMPFVFRTLDPNYIPFFCSV